MATLTWPSGVLPASFDWTLVSNGSSFTSPWNGQSQTVRYPGSAWKASLTLSNLDDLESREIEALIFELDGMSGRIKLWDMGRFPGTTKGAPKVNGANQTGSTLNSNGWTPNVQILTRGSYITVNDEMKMVLQDVTSNAQGLAAIPIAPMLRQSPPNAVVIEVANPYAIFRLEKNENGVKRSPGFNNDITLNFVESF